MGALNPAHSVTVTLNPTLTLTEDIITGAGVTDYTAFFGIFVLVRFHPPLESPHHLLPSRGIPAEFTEVPVKVKVRTLDIAPLRESSPQKRSGVARVLKGFHSFTCTPTRSSAIGRSHTVDENVQFRIWHSAVASSDAAKKKHNMSHTIPIIPAHVL